MALQNSLEDEKVLPFLCGQESAAIRNVCYETWVRISHCIL